MSDTHRTSKTKVTFLQGIGWPTIWEGSLEHLPRAGEEVCIADGSPYFNVHRVVHMPADADAPATVLVYLK